MFQVPVTFLYDDWDPRSASGARRSFIMREFAANGAKHLVLTEPLIKAILGNRELPGILRREMKECGLDFVDAHSLDGPDYDLNIRNPEKRAFMLANQRAALMIAAEMGVKTITFHTGNRFADDLYPIQKHVDCVKRSLDELLPLAEKLGQTICLENVWFTMTQAEQLLSVKAAFPTDALGFCYDAGHANLIATKSGHDFLAPFWKPYGFSVDQIPFDHEILEKLLPHVVNCHLHDNDGTRDCHWPPGQGSIDWKHVAGLLKKAPRLQYIQSEVRIFNASTSIREVCESFARLGDL